MTTAHLPGNCISDNAFAGRKIAVGVAPQSLKRAAFGNIGSIDAAGHGGAEPIKIGS